MSTKTTAIAAGTAEASSSAIDVDAGASIRIRTDKALKGDEMVSVSVCDSDGGNAVKYSDNGSASYVLSASRAAITLSGPGAYLIHKSVTSEAIAVITDS